MYVHLGGEVVVPIQEIVGIFDARMIVGNGVNERFLEIARVNGRIRSEVPFSDLKSIVVTAAGVYASPISSLTLARRVTNIQWGLSSA